jgi:hypothetical protein
MRQLTLFRLVLSLFACLGSTAHARLAVPDPAPPCAGDSAVSAPPAGSPWNNGLPASWNDETQLWAFDPVRNFFTQVPPGQADPSMIYVRYDFGTIDPIADRWVWATSLDPRAIAPGSKLQGWRIGEPTLAPLNRGLNWYRLKPDGATWQWVTDRELPKVYRWQTDGTTVASEIYPDDWASYGGQLDPLPGDKPSCVLTPAVSTITVGQPLTLHLAITGSATAVTLNGRTIGFSPQGNDGTYTADTTVTETTPGFKTATATVTGIGGTVGNCQVNYTVLPASPR